MIISVEVWSLHRYVFSYIWRLHSLYCSSASSFYCFSFLCSLFILCLFECVEDKLPPPSSLPSFSLSLFIYLLSSFWCIRRKITMSACNIYSGHNHSSNYSAETSGIWVRLIKNRKEMYIFSILESQNPTLITYLSQQHRNCYKLTAFFR